MVEYLVHWKGVPKELRPPISIGRVTNQNQRTGKSLRQGRNLSKEENSSLASSEEKFERIDVHGGCGKLFRSRGKGKHLLGRKKGNSRGEFLHISIRKQRGSRSGGKRKPASKKRSGL